MWSSRRRWLSTAGLLAGVAAAPLLGGCGFQRRAPPRLAFGSIGLVGFAPRSELGDALRRRLAEQVRVLERPEGVDVVLEAIEDIRDRSIVASTAAAQVRELQLRQRFVFSARTPLGRVLIPRAELLLQRDLSYSETAALAKAHEEAELQREMTADLVQQVLRRLASVQV